MDVKGFIIRVKDMREAQKAYFKNRTKENLIKSIQLEKEVDNGLYEIAKMFQ